MKTTVNFVISVLVGLIFAWLCYQVGHLESPATTFVSILATSAAWAVCNKASKRKQTPIKGA